MYNELRNLALFQGMPDDALHSLALNVTERYLPAGEELFHQGDSGHDCYVVLDGSLGVIGHAGSDDVLLEVCARGRIVGEMALIDSSPRAATVRAFSDTRVAVLTERDFVALMHSNPAMALDLLRGGTARLRHTSQTMIAGLEQKNAELARAYENLKAAQSELIRLGKIEQELKVARRIQQFFLPRSVPQPSGWEIAAFNRGAQDVGGDFYDCLTLDNGIFGLVVADVCGKGVPAALFVALTRSLLRAASLSPGMLASRDTRNANEVMAAALEFTNNYIVREHAESHMFVTTFYALLEPHSGLLHYLNAGHNPPLLLDGSGELLGELESGSLPVGILPNQNFSAGDCTILPGQTLIIFTDGVTEAMNRANQPFSDERLADILRESGGLSATALLTRIVDAVDAYAAGAPQADDITLMVLHRRPA